MKKLAGIIFTRNCDSQDYCYKQAISSMLGVCDMVYVVDACSTDGTDNSLLEFVIGKKVTALFLRNGEWDEQHGKEKLSYFTNMAIERAQQDGYEYILSCQADEIVDQRSYDAIRKAVDTGAHGFVVSRLNMWGSPFHKLIVEHNRKPCSTTIARLARSNYRAYDDAESLNVDHPISTFHDEIKIWHFGFVRKREVMVDKIKHMQEKVFLTQSDRKLEGMVIFNPWVWFDKYDDVELIDEPLPEIIKSWAEARVYND